MSNQDFVELQARNRRGEIVAQKIIPLYEWYDGPEVPLIDSAKERVRLGIAYILGKQFTKEEGLVVHWLILYDESGELTQDIEWRSDGSKDIRFFSKDGSIEHTHAPPPDCSDKNTPEQAEPPKQEQLPGLF